MSNYGTCFGCGTTFENPNDPILIDNDTKTICWVCDEKYVCSAGCDECDGECE